MPFEERSLPGLRWLAVALTFGRDDNGGFFPSSLGAELAAGLEGAPVGWYSGESGRLAHVPHSRHMMAVHREYEVALVEAAWVEPHAVYAVLHFYQPLSPRAERARRDLLAYEARGQLLQAPGLSIMAIAPSRPDGRYRITERIARVLSLDFVHRPAAEGCLIRSLALDEEVGPQDALARAFAEALSPSPCPPGGSV